MWLGVRHPDQRDDHDYLWSLIEAGIEPLLALVRETFLDQGRCRSYGRCGLYGDLLKAGGYGRRRARAQVGNEADLDSPSSWTMSPSALLALTYEVRDAMPDAALVAAGLASGSRDRPRACRDILDLVDYVAVHPYGRHAGRLVGHLCHRADGGSDRSWRSFTRISVTGS